MEDFVQHAVQWITRNRIFRPLPMIKWANPEYAMLLSNYPSIFKNTPFTAGISHFSLKLGIEADYYSHTKNSIK
jgi:hypothetical protein